MFVLNYTNT